MGEVFSLLSREKIITEKLADHLQSAVGFRNIAVHEYEEIDWRIVHSINLCGTFSSLKSRVMKNRYDIILNYDGKIFIADWKKEDMPQGPPADIRYRPERVEAQLEETGFRNTAVYTDLKKHFLVIPEKQEPSARPSAAAAAPFLF